MGPIEVEVVVLAVNMQLFSINHIAPLPANLRTHTQRMTPTGANEPKGKGHLLRSKRLPSSQLLRLQVCLVHPSPSLHTSQQESRLAATVANKWACFRHGETAPKNSDASPPKKGSILKSKQPSYACKHWPLQPNVLGPLACKPPVSYGCLQR